MLEVATVEIVRCGILITEVHLPPPSVVPASLISFLTKNNFA
jgi:hypothetical protein